MFFNSIKILISGLFALSLLACGGASLDSERPQGNSESTVTGVANPDNQNESESDSTDRDSTNADVVNTPTIDTANADIPPAMVNTDAMAAARLLAQATFGTTLNDIEEVKRLGVDGWLENQFSLKGSSQLAYSQSVPGSGSLSGPRQHKWLLDAINGEDQLRLRVAFAYSEIFVTSDLSQTLTREQYAMANYYDILLEHAFGNYRDLLEAVTLNPVMGLYLSMLQNAKADPAGNTRADENFAREVMQLFSIGLYQLNSDGSVVKDSSGNPRPAYTQRDIEEYARVFTGWNYADANAWNRPPAGGFTNKFLPMRPYPGYHDQGSKQLLRGVVSPAGISTEQDLDIALDSLFNHPNVGPFIGKQLIQRLVTSNPSPGYVARVSAAFNNNGSGVRGDMRAVIKAILVDAEARNGYTAIANYGKLREPLLRWTHLWRAFNVQRGLQSNNGQYNHASPYIQHSGDFLGQAVLSSPSVFNFFHANYAPLGAVRNANLVAPEAEIYSDAYILATTSKLSTLTQIYHQGANENSRNRSYIDISRETAMAASPAELLDHLNLLLMSGQMTSELRSILHSHLLTLANDEAGRSQRVRDAIILIMSSPAYLVQK